MRIAMTITACAVLSACALEPRQVNLAAEHDSHVAQHFGDDRERHGADVVAVTVHWGLGEATLTLSEGYAVKGSDGCTPCSRDRFEARVEMPIWSK